MWWYKINELRGQSFAFHMMLRNCQLATTLHQCDLNRLTKVAFRFKTTTTSKGGQFRRHCVANSRSYLQFKNYPNWTRSGKVIAKTGRCNFWHHDVFWDFVPRYVNRNAMWEMLFKRPPGIIKTCLLPVWIMWIKASGFTVILCRWRRVWEWNAVGPTHTVLHLRAG